MKMFYYSIFVVFLSLFHNKGVFTYQIYNLCTSITSDDSSCQQVARDQDIKCQTVTSKTDCIIDIDQGFPTLSLLNAEEAFLGAGLVSDAATVIGEIIPRNPPYETAVIVKASTNPNQLKNLKYCHPGYDHDERVTKFVLEQLDWEAINLTCNASKTLTEQKFEALSSLFGPSCRPGRWTEDEVLDQELKKKYSSLCELCGSEGCNKKYSTPLNDTLTCLVENDADIALTDLKYAETFFSDSANAEKYRYLCSGGVVAAPPCSWTKQLNRVLITSSGSVDFMRQYIQNKLPSRLTNDSTTVSVIEQHLARILGLDQRGVEKINLLTPISLKQYVAERRTVPDINNNIQCNRTIDWSVTNELELNKCNWLQRASVHDGLQPVISCVSSSENDSISNLDNIVSRRADLAFIDANYGYIALKKKLSNAAYVDTNSAQLSKIVIVIRNDSTWYNGSFKSLQEKSVCLPEYGGQEWLALIDTLRTYKAVSTSCDYGKLFSDFVGQSCAPGARDKDRAIDNTDADKLCEKCIPATSSASTHRYCNADTGNKYYGSFGALRCLEAGDGDYAVITLNDTIEEYARSNDVIFRIISKNESLAVNTGLSVDEQAPIAIIVAGEVVFNNETTKQNDIILYLKELEVVFGSSLRKSFKVFDAFNHTKDLLFPDSTSGLTFGDTSPKFIENYNALLKNAETCNPNNNSADRLLLPGLLLAVLVTLNRMF